MSVLDCLTHSLPKTGVGYRFTLLDGGTVFGLPFWGNYLATMSTSKCRHVLRSRVARKISRSTALPTRRAH